MSEMGNGLSVADIMNWWRVVRERPGDLISMIDCMPNSDSTFSECVRSIKVGIYNNEPLRLVCGRRNQVVELIWAWVVFIVLRRGVVHSACRPGLSMW